MQPVEYKERIIYMLKNKPRLNDVEASRNGECLKISFDQIEPDAQAEGCMHTMRLNVLGDTLPIGNMGNEVFLEMRKSSCIRLRVLIQR